MNIYTGTFFLFQPHVSLNSKEHLLDPMTDNIIIPPDNMTKSSTISFSDNLLTVFSDKN